MGFTFYKNVLLSRIAGLSSSLFCLLLVEPLELSFGDCVHGLSVLTLFLSVVHKNHTHLSAQYPEGSSSAYSVLILPSEAAPATALFRHEH